VAPVITARRHRARFAAAVVGSAALARWRQSPRSRPPPSPIRFHPGADTPDTVGEGPGAGLELVRLGTFNYPTYVTSPRSDNSRQFLVEQDGVIRVRKNGPLARNAVPERARHRLI
jgi:hypothetical protein